MSKLEFFARPLVAFDASDPLHRSYYYEFIKRRSWGWCPVRFICPDQTGLNLVTMIQQELLSYYVTREFETGGRLHRKSVAQKGNKMVDTKPKRQYNRGNATETGV